MKNLFKLFVVLAGLTLLMAGCAQDEFLSQKDGGDAVVTFTAEFPSAPATKATFDNDGNAANVNRCIMEIYYDNTLFDRKYEAVEGKQATFTVTLVANRTYKVAFWADHVHAAGTAPTDDELKIDSCYNTADGLQAVALNGTYVGNDDKRDAFAYCTDYTVVQGGSSFTATLTRPFAQLNVITTDVETVKKVTSLVPDKVDVTIKNAATCYNVLQSTAVGDTTDLNYTASLYNWDADTTVSTLSMDYIFAENTKSVIDIDWKAQKGTNADVEYSFANIPYQRNYRTNIKGNLLTANAQWAVTVDPIWNTDTTGVFDVIILVANTLDEVQGLINDNAGDKSKDKTIEIQVKDTVKTTLDLSIPDKTTTPNWVFKIENMTSEGKIVVKDANPDNNTVNYKESAEVALPAGVTASQVTFNTPKAHGVVSGDFGRIDATTSGTTLEVKAGATVYEIHVHQGNVALYGTVTDIFRGENNKADVIVNIYDGANWTNFDTEKAAEGIKPVVNLGTYSFNPTGYNVKGSIVTANDDDTWTVSALIKVGDKAYTNLSDALAGVMDGETITLLNDYALEDKLLIDNGKSFTLDLGGKTLTGRVNVSGAKVTIKNGTIDAGSFSQALNTYGIKDQAYKDDVFTYIKVEEDVTLKGSYGLCLMTNISSTMYPLAFGVKIDFYGKIQASAPVFVSGNLGLDNYVANIGKAEVGDAAPSITMQLYGPVLNFYGEASSTDDQGISLNGMATVNVYDGASITGTEGIGLKSGVLNVYGGTITSTGAYKNPVEAVSSGVEASGAAISLTSFYTSDIYEDRAKMKVNIEGGTITSENNSALLVTHSYKDSKPVALKQGVELSVTNGKLIGGENVPVVFIDNAADGDAFEMPSKFISGGIFGKEPTESYLADGYDCKDNGDGSFTVCVLPVVAKVGDNEYKKFSKAVAAINALGEGEHTITLCADVQWATGGGNTDMDHKCFTTEGAVVNFDLGGYSIAFTGAGGFRNDATVNVSNGTVIDETCYTYESGETAWEHTYLEVQGGKYSFKDIVFQNNFMFQGTETSVESCEFKNKATLAGNDENEYAVWCSNGKISFKDCKFIDIYRAIKLCTKYSDSVTEATIDGCEFKNIAKKPGVVIDCSNNPTITIKNCTFTGCQAGDQGKYIYESDNAVPVIENCTVDGQPYAN